MAPNSTIAIPRHPPKPTTRQSAAMPSANDNDDARWQLVLAHAPTSSFLYAVLSTHIFCLPSCPSRRPRRANVRYFDSAAAAKAAGFRACRRCRPYSAGVGAGGFPSQDQTARGAVAAACAYMPERAGDGDGRAVVRLLDVAGHVGLSGRYFRGLFKRVMGITPGFVHAVQDPGRHCGGAAESGSGGDAFVAGVAVDDGFDAQMNALGDFNLGDSMMMTMMDGFSFDACGLQLESFELGGADPFLWSGEFDLSGMGLPGPAMHSTMDVGWSQGPDESLDPALLTLRAI
ncbi:Uu.00g022060.m01.CDS01 [Anthostomella pinea]|uniref:Uu.00g022060.m01.CDS01 n=1 Tax=Anthostomella pinea TaxID=933095 RepID=A0AAI8YNT9_9PEZI|nr:Uu.00g022060.m01.CDS01 [Anthostomella pinea]